MMTLRLLRLPAAAVACLGLSALSHGAASQTTNMPGTLRWGSGLLDVPVATVLPHLSVTGTYSGFGISVSERLVVTRSGSVIARGEPYEKWVSDGSIALGLFDRAEIGASIQHYDDPAEGGNLLGGFARISLLPSSVQGLDLAVGARYVTSPSFDPFEDEFRPNRFGYPDSRIVSDADREFNSNLSPYVVVTAQMRGVEADFLPEHDVSLTAGWGSGLFSAGRSVEFYQVAGSGGIFAGSAVHFGMGEGKLLNVMAEFNGFDLNAGVQVDFGGIRAGAFALGLAYDKYSTFRSRKFGVMGSVAFCGVAGGLCKPRLAERPGPDTVALPAPPPDTVFMDRTVEPPLPTGTPATLCLATGAAVQVFVTAQQDTLVGPSRTSLADLRPALDFAGAYAGGQDWFTGDESLSLDDREYSKSGETVQLNCANIMQVGEHEGVPVFAERSQERPYDMVYVPVRPGVWQGYEHGLQRTRG